MSNIFDRVSLLLKLSALLPLVAGMAVLSGIGSSAQAETVNTLDKGALITPSVSQNPLRQAETTSSPQSPIAANQTPSVVPETPVSAATKLTASTIPTGNTQVHPDTATEATGKPSLGYAPSAPSALLPPIPGKTLTSAAVLATGAPITGQFAEPTTKNSTRRIAQTGISPGRITRGGSSYVGIAGNFGISGGGTTLGNTNFTVISKIGLTNAFSVRPAVVIGDDATFLIPLTYDFNINSADAFSESLPFSPYLGAGIAVSTRSNDNVAALLSAGVDVPLSSQFTATAGVNVGFFNNTDIGLLVGVGYNFVGLGI